MKNAVKIVAGDAHFLLPVDDIEEIVCAGVLKKIPGMSSTVDGMMSYGSRMIPVVRLSRLAGSDSSSTNGRLLILRGNSRMTGLIVDRVDGFSILPPSEGPSDLGVAGRPVRVDDVDYHLLRGENVENQLDEGTR